MVDNTQINKFLVLISGEKSSGKDYITDILAKFFKDKNLKAKRISHFNILKQIFCQKNNLTVQ